MCECDLSLRACAWFQIGVLLCVCVCVCIFQLLSCDMCVSVTSRCVHVRGFKLVSSCVCVCVYLSIVVV